MLKRIQEAVNRHPTVHRAIRAVWTPPERVFRHLYFRGVFTVQVDPDTRFLMHSHGQALENDLFWRGYGKGWEGTSLELWRDLVKRSGFIADVGANTGVYALAAQAINPEARVVAIEPSRRVHDRLCDNIRINAFPIVAIDSAASDEEGMATFFDTATEHQYSASLKPDLIGAGAIEVQVKTERLDAVFSRLDFPRLDLMKMDVELNEPAALRGMRKTLERCRPAMLVEILNAEHEEAIRHELTGIDYRFAYIREGEGLSDRRGRDDDSRNVLICTEQTLRELDSGLKTFR